jgi:hypothetical protein
VLAAGTLGALMTDMLMKGLFAVGCGRQVGRRMPIMVVTEVAGLITLVPRYGALGAACSYLLASYLGVILLGTLYLRALQVRLPSLRRLAAYANGFIPTAAAFAMAGRAPTLAAWALVATGVLLFISPARRMGLITDADISFLRGLRAARRPHAPPRARPAAGRTRFRGWPAGWRADSGLAAFCVCVAAVALLYNLFTSPDVLQDEAAYTFAAKQVALGWHLTLNDQPLFVHPPLMFLMQAAWLRFTGHAAGALAPAIRAARLLSASVGVADVLLTAGLAYRLASGASPRRRQVVTGVTAVITALDPVLTRYDRQDVIEPFALCAGLLTLHAAWQLRDRGALAYVSVTGLLGGLALLTNEITVCLVAVPPLFALLDKNRQLLRRSLAASGIAVAFLGLFLLWAAELGLAGSFVNIQTATLQRLIGVLQINGLNAPGVSLAGALVHSVEQYSSSYIVLAAGLAALAWSWSRTNTTSRELPPGVADGQLRLRQLYRGRRHPERAVLRLPAPGRHRRRRAPRGRAAGRLDPPHRGALGRRPLGGRRSPAGPGVPAAAGDRCGRPGGPGGLVRIQLGRELQRHKRRCGAHGPVHRDPPARLRRGQRQRRHG